MQVESKIKDTFSTFTQSAKVASILHYCSCHFEVEWCVWNL